MAVPAPRGTRPPAEDDGPLSAAEFAETTRLCMSVVSPSFEVRPELLTRTGWAWFQPRQVPMGQQTFQMVQYSKDRRSIALLDNGSLVVCRVVGGVENADKLRDVRAALTRTLGAIPLDDIPRLAPLAVRLRSQAPQIDHANLLVAGNYSLELSFRERTSAGTADTPPRTYRMVMVESVPLPQQFQLTAPTSAAQ